MDPLFSPPIEGTPPAPPAPTPLPEPPAPDPLTPPAVDSFSEGGDTETSLSEKIFGKTNGEIGFTGIFIFGLLATALTYQILYYRKLIITGGSYAGLQKQIDELKAANKPITVAKA